MERRKPRSYQRIWQAIQTREEKGDCIKKCLFCLCQQAPNIFLPKIVAEILFMFLLSKVYYKRYRDILHLIFFS